jgi:hypothetical protein
MMPLAALPQVIYLALPASVHPPCIPLPRAAATFRNVAMREPMLSAAGIERLPVKAP